MMENSRTVSFVFAAVAALLFLSAIRVSAQTAAMSNFGLISLDARESEAGPNYLIYKFAHAAMKNGTTLDADELKAVGASGNAVETVTATGHVKAVVTDSLTKRVYTVFSDSAVFDPKANTIDLEGNVKTVVTSSYTEGPLVQTGTSATVFLGSGPDFPKIDMHQVHTELTVKQ